MNKHLTLDYWMTKLGYMRTHWTDEIAVKLYYLYYFACTNGYGSCKMQVEDKHVTLSVKKMKK